MSTPPRWDLTNVYPSLESKEFSAAMAKYKKQIASFEKFFDKELAPGAKKSVTELAPLVGKAIDQVNEIFTLAGTLAPYIQSFVTTNSRDPLAMRRLSEFEQMNLPMDKVFIRFRGWLGKLGPKLD